MHQAMTIEMTGDVDVVKALEAEIAFMNAWTEKNGAPATSSGNAGDHGAH